MAGTRGFEPATLAQRACHPRPSLIRTFPVGEEKSPQQQSGWAKVNGSWHFAFDDDEIGESRLWTVQGVNGNRVIQVPYAYQSELSGINTKHTHSTVWYSKAITPTILSEVLPKSDRPSRVLLHFDAVDYEAWVWLGGHQIAHHVGGHVGFSADITSVLKRQGRNACGLELVVKVKDAPHDLFQPRGKQYWKTDANGDAAPESIFYTPTTGIWQTVWLEAVPLVYLSHVCTIPDIDTGTVRIDVELDGLRADLGPLLIEAEASLVGRPGGSATAWTSSESCRGSLTLSVRADGQHPAAGLRPSLYTAGVLPPEVNRDAWDNGMALWSPEHPVLYDLRISLKTDDGCELDRVTSYFGMRKVSIDQGGRLCLNNRAYFQKLLLDQGYWTKSGLTAPDERAFEVDITLAKELGFNGVRKHQKVENPRFFYEADRLGFLVWGEMANAYEYSSKYAQRFVSEWMEVVRRDASHPCIVAWTPINESWGVPALNTSPQQRAHLASLYHLTKSLDPTRPVIDNDGWQHVQTDLITIHDYRAAPQLQAAYSSRTTALQEKVVGYPVFVDPSHPDAQRLPILCTEFGGLAVKGGAKGWGYSEAADEESFLAQFEALTMALVEGGVVQGFCYTQLADVEQEVNGLLTADRKHKLDPVKVKRILDAIKPAV